MNPQYPPNRPQGRPNRPPMTREEAMRRQAYYRKIQQRKQMQRRIAILAVAALFVIFTVILISVVLHRSSEPVNLPDPVTTDDAETESPAATASPADTTAPLPSRKDITICIDPGHGYDDPGADTVYLGELTEMDITLAIGLKLRDELLDRGYTIIMTHDTNDIPAGTPAGEQYLFGLAKRTAFANEKKPDFYLSIHGDTFEDASVQGSRVYFQSITGADNSAITAMAQHFVDELTIALPDAKKAPMLKEMMDDSAYYVLRNVDMPAVLVEVGFASNPTDAANMLDPTWQAKIAEALAKGVERCFP